jgi:hypothetical protein
VSAARAPVTCPSCGRKVTGRWHQGQEPEPQRCPCGHTFDAAWPGFTFEPETVIISPDQEPGRGAA